MSSGGGGKGEGSSPSSTFGGGSAGGGPSRGKSGAVGRKKLKTSASKSAKAGLHFPVGRIGRYLKDGRYAPRIGVKASVFMAAVLEYLCTEVLDLAANEAKDAGKARISPRHIQLAVRNDEELNTLLGSVTIASGGVIPQVNPVLFHRKSKSGGTTSSKSKAGGAKVGGSGGSGGSAVSARKEGTVEGGGSSYEG